MQSNAIANGAHSVLPDSKADIALLRRILLEVTKHLKQCHVGRRKISTTSNKTRHNFSKCVQALLGEVPGGISWALRSVFLEEKKGNNIQLEFNPLHNSCSIASIYVYLQEEHQPSQQGTPLR